MPVQAKISHPSLAELMVATVLATSPAFALLATPAFSQNTDVEQRAVEAYVACIGIKGDLAMAAPNFALYGWTDREDTEAGTRFTKPDWAETTSALLSKP
jgi:hypothetical protein